MRIGDVVTEALDMVRPIASEHNIALSAAISSYSDRYVQADRQRLKQVLLNLLSNAIKFNRSNGLVAVSCQEISDGRLCIKVTDTGAGIDEEGLKKIFTPFERLNADRDAVGGTGLGLALCKRMIEAMGGAIRVESALGSGSTFRFELDLVDHAVEDKKEEGLPAILRSSGKDTTVHGKVLYVEDNLSNVRLLEEIVACYPGVQLLEAMQGKLGLDLASTHIPDWILLDLHLPDLSGEKVLRRLKKDPRTGKIPVTVLSADALPARSTG